MQDSYHNERGNWTKTKKNRNLKKYKYQKTYKITNIQLLIAKQQ